MEDTLKKIILHFKDTETKLTHNVSSIMQGVLMENVSYSFGKEMHKPGIKPYSQYLINENGQLAWVINTLSSESGRELILPLLEDDFQNVYLKHKDLTLTIEGKIYNEIKYSDLLRQTFFSECRRYITIKFKTPTAFKTNNRYQFYPSVEHIFKSLVNKFNACGFESEINFDESLYNINDNIKIINYSLKSTVFYMENIKIPSFIGKITFKIKGPQPLINLVHLLLKFGEFSGVGIKTAIGMGAIEIIKRKGNNNGETREN